jgi:K(+)-stimulated pyrophosphate-energized sodium pump
MWRFFSCHFANVDCWCWTFGIFSIYLFVRISSETASVQNALNLGNWLSIAITFVSSYFLVHHLLPDTLNLRGFEFTSNGVFLAIIVGLVVGALMSAITEYYTAMGKRPVLSIIEKSGTGHATNIIGGLAVGMESTVLPILVLAAGIIFSYKFAGLYGVSIAAAGMMATTAMQLAIDALNILQTMLVVLLKCLNYLQKYVVVPII